MLNGSFAQGDVGWFLEGELNACYNCVDRHAIAHPDKVRGKGKKITNSLILLLLLLCGCTQHVTSSSSLLLLVGGHYP